MSPPPYEPLLADEKLSARLESQEEEEELYVNESTLRPPRSSLVSTLFRTCVKAVACTIVLVFAVGACFLSGAFIGTELAEIVKPTPNRGGGARFETVTEYVTVTERGSWKWWNKRTVREEEEQFSTSTLRDGSTQTFVYTTRPIVNPGGYTIGTLTGYVPVSTQAQDAGPTTTTAEPTETPQSSSSTLSSSSSSSTRSASTIPHSASSTSFLPSRTPSPNTSTPSDSWSRISTTSVPFPTSTSIVERDSTPTGESQEFDFDEVDYHLLHRRGLDFESEPSSLSQPEFASPIEEEFTPSSLSTVTSIPSSTSTTTMTGVEEFSTSTDRKGQVYTLVKTTRPILNPGGYTIGTLNGGWIDVEKIKPTSTATLTPPSSKRSSGHEELRKREVTNL
ncbi:hypothetical protein JCM5350_003923 [Sporobolomyces pararoseus]